MNNKGMELSINFLVMLILAIVIFSFGIIFVSSLFKGGHKMITELPTIEEAVLENCIKKGEAVCLPKNRKEIPEGKSDVFGLAVVNRLGTERDFYVGVSFSVAYDKEDQEITGVSDDKWTFPDNDIGTIKNNEHVKMPVPMSVPYNTKKGEYVFNVNVCYNDANAGNNAATPDEKCPLPDYPDLYETTHKIYVSVI